MTVIVKESEVTYFVLRSCHSLASGCCEQLTIFLARFNTKIENLKVSGEIQKLENLESSQENRIKKD
jgi:hypothetical protein